MTESLAFETLAHSLALAPWLDEHGVPQDGRPLAEQYAHLLGEPQQCYMYASTAGDAEPALRYTEGLLRLDGIPPFQHAWLTDPEGQVVEVTPLDGAPGRSLGVPIVLVLVVIGRGTGRGGYYDPALPGLIELGWTPGDDERTIARWRERVETAEN